MKTIRGALLLAALTFGAGCAKSDWIERTLVTVDVTGTWSGSVGGRTSRFLFELEQQGQTVKGSFQVVGGGHNVGYEVSTRPIAGTVAGDVFRFRQTYGGFEGELTVNGDEMIGQVSGGDMGSPRSISLRRVDPVSRPDSPPR
jgi:hypothetical protein